MTYSASVLADTPQAYYRLNESSGIVAHDSSGNGYDGTLTGVATYSVVGAISEDSDTAMSFTASGGLSVPYALNYTTFAALSLEFWVKIAGWNYILVTCDNTTTLIYLNTSIFTVSRTGGIVLIDSLFDRIMTSTGVGLDEVAIYNKVVASHYGAALPHNIRGNQKAKGRDGLAIGKGTEKL